MLLLLYQLLHVYFQFHPVLHCVFSLAQVLIITADGRNYHLMYIYATDPLFSVI